MTTNAERDKIIRQLIENGFSITRLGKHGTILDKWVTEKDPNGTIIKKRKRIQVPGTPGDSRSLKNLMSDLKNLGESISIKK